MLKFPTDTRPFDRVRYAPPSSPIDLGSARDLSAWERARLANDWYAGRIDLKRTIRNAAKIFSASSTYICAAGNGKPADPLARWRARGSARPTRSARSSRVPAHRAAVRRTVGRLIDTFSEFSEDTINFDFLQDTLPPAPVAGERSVGYALEDRGRPEDAAPAHAQREERMLASSVSAHFLPLWRVRFSPDQSGPTI
jgi:hypothetical protein